MAERPNVWQIGKVTVTRVVELEASGLPPGLVLSDIGPEDVKKVAWLRPHYADADGMITMSVHAYVLESEGKRIIVDTCIGNDKPRASPLYDQLDNPFLERLAAAGYPVESIDVVLCTHLHIDHVGWNTRLVDGVWVPTFPNARYLFGKTEWEYWSDTNRNTGDVVTAEDDRLLSPDAVMADSIRPIVEAGLHDLVETSHRLTGEICLMPTPGHTPGHVSVRVVSDGMEAVIMGDMIHHPVQIADATVGSHTDWNVEYARQTRECFLANHADSNVLILGTHFPTPSAGHIFKDGKTWRLDTAGQILTEPVTAIEKT